MPRRLRVRAARGPFGLNGPVGPRVAPDKTFRSCHDYSAAQQTYGFGWRPASPRSNANANEATAMATKAIATISPEWVSTHVFARTIFSDMFTSETSLPR